MKIFAHISFLICSYSVLACNAGEEQVQVHNEDIQNIDSSRIYANEYGTVTLIQLNDTLWQTRFENNDQHIFDTTMVLAKNDSSILLPGVSNQELYLSFHWGGLSISQDEIQIQEFSSYGELQTYTKIENMYSRNFYRLGREVSIAGDINRGKGTTIKGIWIEADDDRDYNLDYAFVYGVLHKEKYPEAYYSTDESPQGMFSKEDGIQYRLIFEDPDFEKPQPFIYNGYPVKLSTGEAAIAWEFADSEAYILEGHIPWTEEELNQKITVEGYLVQDSKGSVLKNWRIIDGY